MVFDSLFEKMFGRTSELSGADAKNRLRLVLINDRSNIPQTMMEAIRAEMIEVLTKYVEIDQRTLEVQIEKDQGAIDLVLNIPIRRVKSEQEAAHAVAEALRIQAIRAELQAQAEGATASDETAPAPADAPANDPADQTLSVSVPAADEAATVHEADVAPETPSPDTETDREVAAVEATETSSETVTEPET